MATAPNAVRTARRRYRGPTLVLETEFAESGEVAVIDFMPIAERHQPVEVELCGLRGTVPMRMEAACRLRAHRTVDNAPGS